MIYRNILQKKEKGEKMFAVLIDPDKAADILTVDFVKEINKYPPDFVLVGGSLLFQSIKKTVAFLKENINVPVLLFPGNAAQFVDNVDALLLLSLISGRNPEFLIGQHVLSSCAIQKSEVEVLSTGYLLVDGGKRTSVEYMSNTVPIPNDKPEIALATALAGELLGNKLIYLEAGSGAPNPVPAKIIAAVKKTIRIPLIVGGGICSATDLRNAFDAGADIVVCGNSLEKNPLLLKKFVAETRKNFVN